MRLMAVGSVIAVIMLTGVFVSQVEAKTDKHDDKGTQKQVYKFEAKHDKHAGNYQVAAHNYKHDGNGKSVPIPGTLLLLGGGFAGLVAWRARRRQPGA